MFKSFNRNNTNSDTGFVLATASNDFNAYSSILCIASIRMFNMVNENLSNPIVIISMTASLEASRGYRLRLFESPKLFVRYQQLPYDYSEINRWQHSAKHPRTRTKSTTAVRSERLLRYRESNGSGVTAFRDDPKVTIGKLVL